MRPGSASLPTTPFKMLRLTAAATFAALAAVAAPTKQVVKPVSYAAVPYSDHTVAISKAVPMSRHKLESLKQLCASGGSANDYSAPAASFEFFGTGSGVSYGINITAAGQTVAVIFDTGR